MAVRHVKAMVERPEEPQQNDGLTPIHHGKFTLSSSGLSVKGKPTFEEWEELGGILAVMDRGIAFLIGDWLEFGEREYGEMAAQVIDARSWSPDTVRAYRWLSKKVPTENRMVDRGLSVAHHQAVASLPAPEQKRWLRQALNDGAKKWSVPQLRAAVKEGVPQEVAAWYLVVRCANEADRTNVQREMEGRGYQCRLADRRVPKTIDVQTS